MKAGEKIRTPTPTPSSCAAVPTNRKRGPPMATLFIAIMETVVALGSGLNCMAAIQKPPRKVSISKFRYSA
ncbi:hypothetical protein D3C76_1550230 [compost metagenome]